MGLKVIRKKFALSKFLKLKLNRFQKANFFRLTFLNPMGKLSSIYGVYFDRNRKECRWRRC